MTQPLPVKIYKPLWLTPVGRWRGRRLWEQVAPFIFQVGDMKFASPAGFRCDLCSIPRVPPLYEICGDTGQEGGAGHDYCYRKDAVMQVGGKFWTIPKDTGDLVFLSLMTYYQDPPDEDLRHRMFDAVRLAGGPSFRKLAVMERFLTPGTPKIDSKPSGAETRTDTPPPGG